MDAQTAIARLNMLIKAIEDYPIADGLSPIDILDVNICFSGRPQIHVWKMPEDLAFENEIKSDHLFSRSAGPVCFLTCKKLSDEDQAKIRNAINEVKL